jgi:hypothetical protein
MNEKTYSIIIEKRKKMIFSPLMKADRAKADAIKSSSNTLPTYLSKY